jgi:hypothetical protein
MATDDHKARRFVDDGGFQIVEAKGCGFIVGSLDQFETAMRLFAEGSGAQVAAESTRRLYERAELPKLSSDLPKGVWRHMKNGQNLHIFLHIHNESSRKCK